MNNMPDSFPEDDATSSSSAGPLSLKSKGKRSPDQQLESPNKRPEMMTRDDNRNVAEGLKVNRNGGSSDEDARPELPTITSLYSALGIKGSAISSSIAGLLDETKGDFRVDQPTLWHASIPDNNQGSDMEIDAPADKTELNNPKARLSKPFPQNPDHNAYIVDQRRQLVHTPTPAQATTLLPGHLSDKSTRMVPPAGPPRLARESFNAILEKQERDIFHADTPISCFLRSFVQGNLSIPDADCCVKGFPRTWLRHTPQESSRPALYLLHPNRPHQTTTTSPSVQALNMIKKLPDNDMITFFGVSGCGKTRAVVEILAQNWGFYLNGSQEDRGSKDITTLFESAQENEARYFSSKDKVQNGRNIQAITGCLLISRLMILQYCLSLDRPDTFTCERWMLLQLCPGAFDATIPDVFDAVFKTVLGTYHKQIPTIPLRHLKHLLQGRFRQVQDQISSIASILPSNKLLVVLDEAQILSDHGKDSFITSTESRELRSLLSPIVHGLRNISESGQDYCVVTCGTGISADELESLVASGSNEQILGKIDHRIVDFPGWESEDQVASYINNLGVAMSEDDKAMLRTLLPEAAIHELFFKLRGRFRPIISAIEDIIAKGPTSSWKEAIDRRLLELVCYPKQFPKRGNLCSDIKRMIHKVDKDEKKYAGAIDIKHILKKVVLHHASLGLPWSLRGEEPIMVESSFARLRIVADVAASGQTTTTMIDEPFVFQAAYNFVQHEEQGFYQLFKDQYRDLQDPQSEGKIFERHAPLDLIHVFHQKQLKRELFPIVKAAAHRVGTALKIPIPQFEPITFHRHFFMHVATIVGWEGFEWGIRHNATLTMDDFLEARYYHGSRRGNWAVPPFYYPEPSHSGPDIVFVLRIENQLYPVFVQTKLLGKISSGVVEDARMTVHEIKLKAHLPNMSAYCPGGKYLSLIYVYPTVSKKQREVWGVDDLLDMEPETGTDCNQGFKKDGDTSLMQLLMVLDGSNMHEFLPEGVVKLLNEVKGTK